VVHKLICGNALLIWTCHNTCEFLTVFLMKKDFSEFNPCASLWTFLSFSVLFVFLITLPVLKLTAKNLAQVCIFIGILLFHGNFLKKIFFCIRYKKYSLSAPFGQKMPPLKPIKTAIFKSLVQLTIKLCNLC